jgi:hypothetical protein
VRTALDWIEVELTKIEAQLPPRYADDEPQAQKVFPTTIPPQTIAGTMTTPRFEQGAVIEFRRRPQPWQHGDIIKVFHEPSGHTTLIATEIYRYIYIWKSENGMAGPFHLEPIDDYNYRIVLPDTRALISPA